LPILIHILLAIPLHESPTEKLLLMEIEIII